MWDIGRPPRQVRLMPNPEGRQCLRWVKTGKAQCEQMFSGLRPKADIGSTAGMAFIPNPTSCERPLCAARSGHSLMRHRGVCSGCYGVASTLRTRVRLRTGGSTRHDRHPAKGNGKFRAVCDYCAGAAMVGKVFSFSRQRGCPAEIIMRTQCFHRDDCTQNADGLQ